MFVYKYILCLSVWVFLCLYYIKKVHVVNVTPLKLNKKDLFDILDLKYLELHSLFYIVQRILDFEKV